MAGAARDANLIRDPIRASLLNGGFAVALILFLAIAAVCIRTIHEFVEAARWVDHTHSVRVDIEELETRYLRLHQPWRNFMLAGDAESLAEFNREAGDLYPVLEGLKALTGDDAGQQSRLRALERFMAQDLAALSGGVTRRMAGALREPAREAERIAAQELQRHEISQLIFDIRFHEEDLLAARRAKWQQDARLAYGVIIGGNVAGFAMLIAIFVLMLRENASRRNAQEAMQRYASEIEDLYNNAPCAYHSLDADGVFRRINDTELAWLGYTREEIVGRRRFSDLLTPDGAARFMQNFPAFKEYGRVSDVEYDLVRRDGSVLPVSLSATAAYDADGIYVMSRSTMFDITERRRASLEIKALHADLTQHASRLEATNRELESFSYSVSHDLRAPLRAIDGFSRIVQEDYAEIIDAEGKRLLAVIRDNASRMGRLIDDLLEFSRMGRKPIELSRVDMASLAAEVMEKLQSQEGAQRAAVEVAPMPAAECDPALMRQVWINLLANAFKFSGKCSQPRVAVSGADSGSELVYSVQDNGAGFDMKYYDKLFGVFQRLHGADEFPGTGVGLAIVQRVVARHGGRVWAESVPGKGASFHFSLPRAGDDA